MFGKIIIASLLVLMIIGCAGNKIQSESNLPVKVINVEEIEDSIWESFDEEWAKEIFVFYKKSAANGGAQAQYVLGLYYENKNPHRANQYILSAASQNHLGALKKLAKQYYYGINSPKDREKSFVLYTELEGLGDIYSQYMLGFMYEHGQGVEKDLTKAFEQYKQSAIAGSISGQLALASLYRYGIGTEKNNKKAKYWYQKAAAQGDADAKTKLLAMSGISGDPTNIIEGRWRSDTGTCEDNGFDYSVSKDGKKIITMRLNGKVSYANILAVEPNQIHLSYDKEKRKTADGDLVSWWLVYEGVNSYRMRRNDWQLNTLTNGAWVRCNMPES